MVAECGPVSLNTEAGGGRGLRGMIVPLGLLGVAGLVLASRGDD